MRSKSITDGKRRDSAEKENRSRRKSFRSSLIGSDLFVSFLRRFPQFVQAKMQLKIRRKCFRKTSSLQLTKQSPKSAERLQLTDSKLLRREKETFAEEISAKRVTRTFLTLYYTITYLKKTFVDISRCFQLVSKKFFMIDAQLRESAGEIVEMCLDQAQQVP